MSINAISVGINTSRQSSLWTHEESMAELSELARTANIKIIDSFSQTRDMPQSTSYIGKGKVEEIKLYCKEHCIGCVIFDDDLTPAQSKFLEKELNAKVIDRTGLILDIFALRAHTYEAKLQVEMAQLNYLMPRLTRLWTHLSRLGGGIGTRGPGEKQLEVDKRQITRRLGFIKRKLAKVKQDRGLRRKNRKTLPLISGAIVGYTNAGKSTLLNTLTQSDVLAENKLFATLDPTSRNYRLPNKMNFILTDTVGFIQKLPHHLVKAFYSTLEEVTEADFIIHVIDASSPNMQGCINTASDIIKTLKADSKPQLYLFNKWDQVKKPNMTTDLIKVYQPQLRLSILHEFNIEHFQQQIEALLEPFNTQMTFHVPFTRMDVFNLLHQYGDVHSVDYQQDMIVEVTINQILGDKIMAALY